MSTLSTVSPREPMSDSEAQAILDAFNRDGCVKIGQVLDPDEIGQLKAAIDAAFASPKARDEEHIYSPYVITRLFEFDRRFRDLMVREPIISLMEKVLGEQCHVIANNAVRNEPGQAIDSFHVDDVLWFPLPEGIERFDPRMTFPTFLLQVQIPLTDVDEDQFGPTQYVPGSHYSGRRPNDLKQPTWEGQGPVSLHVKAGEAYLQHPEVWHRGAPNTSSRTRYLLQYAFGMRFISQRFYPFLNYRMPDHVLEGADDRLLRVLGKHPKGAYG